MDIKKSYLIDINKSIAHSFLSQYEHLGDTGLGVWHKGLIIQESLAVVLSFGTTCFASNRGFLSVISKKYRLKIFQLCRGATADWAPKNTPSRAISLSLKDISKKYGPNIIVAYADPKFHEIGTIYQASNAFCTGWTNSKGQANYIINNKKISGWVVRKKYGTRDRNILKKIDPNLKIIPLTPKIRYVFINTTNGMKKAILNELSSYIVKHPKRVDYKIPNMDIRNLIKERPNKRMKSDSKAYHISGLLG